MPRTSWHLSSLAYSVINRLKLIIFTVLRMFFLASLRKNDLNSKLILRLRLVFIKNLMSRCISITTHTRSFWIFKIVSLFNYQGSTPWELHICWVCDFSGNRCSVGQRMRVYHRIAGFVNSFFKVFWNIFEIFLTNLWQFSWSTYLMQ